MIFLWTMSCEMGFRLTYGVDAANNAADAMAYADQGDAASEMLLSAMSLPDVIVGEDCALANQRVRRTRWQEDAVSAALAACTVPENTEVHPELSQWKAVAAMAPPGEIRLVRRLLRRLLAASGRDQSQQWRLLLPMTIAGPIARGRAAATWPAQTTAISDLAVEPQVEALSKSVADCVAAEADFPGVDPARSLGRRAEVMISVRAGGQPHPWIVRRDAPTVGACLQEAVADTTFPEPPLGETAGVFISLILP